MALVASEMVSNQVKHAGGRGLIQIWQQPGPVLDILALDYGPGIANLALAEEDGYSCVNTLGKGLGSIRRLSDESFVYTQQESHGRDKKMERHRFSGAVLPRRQAAIARTSAKIIAALKIGLFSRSLSDDRYNGDRIYLQHNRRNLALAASGWPGTWRASTSGHRQSRLPHLPHCDTPAAILAAVDRQLKDTRGAVAIVGELGLAGQALNILGVGDMHAHVMENEEMHNLSFAPGVLGKEHK